MTPRQHNIYLKSYSEDDLSQKINAIQEEGHRIVQIIKLDNSFVSGSEDVYGNYIIILDKEPYPDNKQKPTLGVMPKKLWDETRYTELCRAITERYNAGQEIRSEWIEEYNELLRTI